LRSIRPRCLLTLTLISLLGMAPAWADDDGDNNRKGRHSQQERKEEYRDGRCKVKLEWKKNGDFLHERQCDGGGDGYAERKQTFRDGPCRVTREWKKNGDYKEERHCDNHHGAGHDRRHARAQRPVVVAAPPPWVVIEEGRPVYRPGKEPRPEPRPVESRHCRSETVGRVLGGAIGAVIGSQVGKDSELRPVTTIGGAVIGVLIGGEIGRSIDAGNQACIGHALEFATTGQRVAWSDDARHYGVVPGRAVAQGASYCRPYELEVFDEGRWHRSRGRACRGVDGAWRAEG
jgi:surface antigen